MSRTWKSATARVTKLSRSTNRNSVVGKTRPHGRKIEIVDRMMNRLVRRQRAFELTAFDELHYQVSEPVLFANIVQSTDMRMIESRDGPGFPLEAFGEL